MVQSIPSGTAIVDAANAVNDRTSQTAYVLGGKSEATGFDCSYFVYLALHAVDPGYTYLSSINIANNTQFAPVTDGPKPGDIIYFSPGTVPYDGSRGVGHVGIVTQAGPPLSFVGKQSRRGDGHVSLSNPYWGSRSYTVLRYQGSGAAR